MSAHNLNCSNNSYVNV